MPDRMPENMPDRMPEDVSDRMPEDLPVTKCINFMVGITRSKVIKILTSKCASRHNGVHFFDISTSKSGPNPNVFKILTSKCASRHNGVHFFDISTSKSGPRLKCFVHFDFEMCFAPPRRSLFRHLNFQKWSEHCSFFFVHVDFEMCFAPQQLALFHLSSGQLAPHPLL